MGPLLINTYTLATYSMVVVSIVAIFFVNILLAEDYAGIVSDDEKKGTRCYVLSFLIFNSLYTPSAIIQRWLCIFLTGGKQ